MDVKASDLQNAKESLAFLLLFLLVCSFGFIFCFLPSEICEANGKLDLEKVRALTLTQKQAAAISGLNHLHWFESFFFGDCMLK